MSKIRIEYLFPNIENKRKLKWLENATFVRSAEDHEVVNFTLSEYLYRFRKENIQYTNGQNQYITEEVNKEHYENWKKKSQSNIFDLDGETVRLDNSILSSLADHLAQNPLELPYFLEQNAINIIGLFLGERILFSNMRLASSFHYPEYELCHAQKISEEEYRRTNFEAKYKLSLFLSVIDELLKRGINLEEFSFVDLRDCSTYQEAIASLWNQKLVETMDVSSYRRSDGQSFNREEMLSFINFSTLSEFLTCIMNLVEEEYYINFIEDAVTMNPEQVVVLPNYMTNDFSFIAKENLVNVKDLCERFQYKLKTFAMETEVIILKRKLAELRGALSEKEETAFDNKELRKQIEALYQEILALTTEKRKELIQVLKQILENNNMSIDLEENNSQLDFSSKKKEEGTPCDSSNKSTSTLEEKVEELSKKVENLEKRVTSLENSLKEYLEHSGVMPNLDNANLFREEIIALIKEYRPTTMGAFFRKIELF